MSTIAIRDFTAADKAAVMDMVTTFYTGPGVLHPIPPENFGNAYAEMCEGGSARLRGVLVEVEGQPAGYCQLSFSYSTEAGGAVVLVEEVYIAPEYRGLGLGGRVFRFIKEEYRGKAARLRLEVAPDNTRAAALYGRLGFEELPYKQMIAEDF